jgi:hypothetical protein
MARQWAWAATLEFGPIGVSLGSLPTSLGRQGGCSVHSGLTLQRIHTIEREHLSYRGPSAHICCLLVMCSKQSSVLPELFATASLQVGALKSGVRKAAKAFRDRVFV